MTLLELQRLFKSDLQLETSNSLPWVRAGRFAPKRRLDVYQYAVHARIKEAVAEDFPLLEEKFGKRAMDETLGRFLKRFPSQFASLSEISQSLPAFLAESGEAALSELARYEWHQILSEHASPSHGVEPISRLGEVDFESVRLIVDPSVFFFESAWRVDEDLREEKTFLLIRKLDEDVLVEPMEMEQWLVLQAIAMGESVFTALTRMLDPSPEKLQNWFFSWVREGIIVGFQRRGKNETHRQTE